MGYSTPKTPLDLKEFLSQPGKPSRRRQFQYRPSNTAPATNDDAETFPAAKSNRPDNAD